jgi:hypothetical protein
MGHRCGSVSRLRTFWADDRAQALRRAIIAVLAAAATAVAACTVFAERIYEGFARTFGYGP